MPMNAINTTTPDLEAITRALAHCLTETSLPIGKKCQGKVRDSYDLNDRLLLITTDRLSAFDRHIASIPYKGQVLNLLSAWWFEATGDLVPNHLLAVPDPNAIIAKKCTVFPIEFVVRGYITGTTSTALWTQYQEGVRHYCGHDFPEGLRKNQQLSQPILTPTTKDKVHDRPISAADIVREGWMSEADWEEASALALRLFHLGVDIAAKKGLILVDTKYEFGRDASGQLCVVDEIHTPDSSRYWLSESYAKHFAEGLDPENFDKEWLRLWFKSHCDPYHDAILPEAPIPLIATLSSRYIDLYERLTGNPFHFPDTRTPIETRIWRNLAGYVT